MLIATIRSCFELCNRVNLMYQISLICRPMLHLLTGFHCIFLDMSILRRSFSPLIFVYELTVSSLLPPVTQSCHQQVDAIPAQRIDTLGY